MLCGRCGVVNEEGDQFCGHCGNLLMATPSAGHWRGDPSVPPGASTAQPVTWGVQGGTPSPLPATVYPAEAGALPPSAVNWQAAQTVAVPQPVQPAQMVPPASAGTWIQPPAHFYPSPSATGWTAPAGEAPATFAHLPIKKRPRRRWPWYFLLLLVILGLSASASWIFVLRPQVHQSVDGEIRQGLQQAVDQIPLDVARRAPANFPFPVTEEQINAYIDAHSAALAPITSMHVSLQPGVMVVDFQAYGFGSTVRLGLNVQDGKLIANNVQVSGLLWWVESADELTPRLNEALSQVDERLGRQISSVTIDDGVLQAIFA